VSKSFTLRTPPYGCWAILGGLGFLQSLVLLWEGSSGDTVLGGKEGLPLLKDCPLGRGLGEYLLYGQEFI